MRIHFGLNIRRCAFIAAAAVSLSACGGGISAPTNGTANPPGQGQASTLTVQGSFTGAGPQLYAHKNRVSLLKRRSLTFTSYSAAGTIYPADAGTPITQTGPATLSGGVYSASLSFSNVPVHNNEWIVMEFSGKAADGSTVDLGELAGVVNVTASPANSASLTQLTTQRYEAFAALLATGYVSTYQVDSNATLMTTIANGITASGAVLDPSTGLFDESDLIKIVNNLAPALQRTVTVNPAVNTKGSVVILRDYTNQNELTLAANTGISLFSFAINLTTNGSQVLKVGSVLGGGPGFITGCGLTAGIVAHTVPNIKIAPTAVSSCLIPNPTGGSTTVANVYSGNILVGATNNAYAVSGTAPAPPFSGGWVAVAQGAPGTVTAPVPIATTSMTITMNDPAGFAFPTAATFTLQSNFGNSPLAQTTFSAGITSGWHLYVPPTYATGHSITIDTFNPWKIATVALCGGINCYATSAAQPFVIAREFMDPGTALTYFNWTKGGTVSSVSAGSATYNISTSGAGTGTLSTTKPTVLMPQQIISVATTLPSGTVFTVTAHDAAAKTYTNSGIASCSFVYPGCPSTANIAMSSIGNITNITSLTFSFNTTAASSYTFAPITVGSPL